MNSYKLRRKKCTGFSLVELLVVIAIIAVLIALLLPFISQALRNGRESTCLNNMRQWAVAVASLQASGAKYFPSEGQGSTSDVNEKTAWFNVLPPLFDEEPLSQYLLDPELEMPRPGDRSVYNCPDVSKNAPGLKGLADNKPFFSYAQNLYIEDNSRSDNSQMSKGIMPFAAVDTPSLFVYMAEVEGASFANVDGRFVYYRHGTPVKEKSGGPRGDFSRANFAFLDGHAQAYDSKDVFTTARSQNRKIVWDPTADLLDD